MYTNGYTMYCETPGCAFNSFKPTGQTIQTSLPDVLAAAEVERIYREGYDAHHAGLQFHESPYARAGADVPDDDYQRGMEWRRGWNDAALGKEPPAIIVQPKPAYTPPRECICGGHPHIRICPAFTEEESG
jgi:hypothetical protein